MFTKLNCETKINMLGKSNSQIILITKTSLYVASVAHGVVGEFL